jgi:hypothetical protein
LASLAVDISLHASPAEHDYVWETPQLLTVAVLGAATVAAGVLGRGRTERNYGPWLYGMGLVGLAVGLSVEAFESSSAGWGAVWMIAALAVLALSVLLQERLFAVAGLVAVFAYLAKLVFDVFESANAALALVVLGLLVLGVAMLYQRFGGRVFAPRENSPP